ncbi:BTB/POZ and MATH domain-containing protein 1-like [Lolium rigidum]|uniref:BTB/POZ and MATH domain-containing protein 1-like n=1 Tax=Lolium rigidum TaxID=89674 RepID=UPI001F5E3019|nr:BTB/POZ and MATH domain-containing protein 1-like [Lolium rigidum]
MSTSGAVGKTWRSASTIVATKEIGYHLLKIDGYSHTKSIPCGECIRSRPFTVGSHRWRLCYYPNGYELALYKDYICISLMLDEDVATVVYAKHVIYFAEEQASSTVNASPVDRFSSRGRSPYPKFVRWREDFEKPERLRNDSVTIRCDIIVINDCRTEDTSFSSVPPCDLRQHFGDLLDSQKGADVVFEVAGETMAAHRCVLAARSSVFCAELFGSMKEGDSAGVVRIEDMEADVFRDLLFFAYTGTLRATQDEDCKLQNLLVAADRYAMERLKLICEEKLCRDVEVGSVATVLALAEQHHCDNLKKACFELLSSQANMRAAMATDGFEHLRRSCPSLVDELIAMSLASQLCNTPMF